MKAFQVPTSSALFALAATILLLCGCGEKPGDFFAGYAEADYVRLAAPIAGTVTKLYVKRGDRIARNAPAFVLEQENERAAREEAAARVQHAQAQLDDLKKGKRPDELAALQAQLAQAQAALNLSSANLARERKLVAEKFLAPARLDELRSAVERDQGGVNDVRAQLRLAQQGARSDEIVAAGQDLKTAQAQLEQANWKLEQKTQRSPVDAQVVDLLYREGELVPAGSPVLSLLPPQNIRARFFVPETAVGGLRVGQDVTLRCDGCGAAIGATVSFIAHDAEYTSPLIYSKENRSTLVFMIEAVPAADDALRLHPGQPLEIRLAAAKNDK